MIVGSSPSYFPLLQVLVLQQSIQRIQAKRQRYRGQTYKCNVSNPNNTTGGAVSVALTGRRGNKASGLGESRGMGVLLRGRQVVRGGLRGGTLELTGQLLGYGSLGGGAAVLTSVSVLGVEVFVMALQCW